MDYDRALQDFRMRSDELKVHETERQDLVEDLVNSYGSLRHELNEWVSLFGQLTLDLEDGEKERQRLQNLLEAGGVTQRSEKHVRSSPPFVVVLIDADGDGYMFKDTFWNQNEDGGRLAADELLTQVNSHLESVSPDLIDVDIKVCAYANFTGLEKACKNRQMKTTASLRLFATGFTARHALFDFVDVGAGKERADHKIRESLTFYAKHEQCSHIILGIAHDSGYVPSLQQFAANKHLWNKITLLEGHQISPTMQGLGFRRQIKFPSVFAQGSALTTPTQSFPKSATVDFNTFIDGADGPFRLINMNIISELLGPILKDGKGTRYEKPLHVRKELIEATEAYNICPRLYLAGFCHGCDKDHESARIHLDMWNALWIISRREPCPTKYQMDMDCIDTKCIYGHGSLQAGGGG
ncbi:MAG: hypothetical protein Q9226_007279 [Calogaya cf. arnoldii]